MIMVAVREVERGVEATWSQSTKHPSLAPKWTVSRYTCGSMEGGEGGERQAKRWGG